MSQYFSEPYDNSDGNVKVAVDISYYSTKTDLQGAAGIDISMLALKTDLVSLKPKVDKLDVDKLKTVPAGLGKLSNVMKNCCQKTVW